MPVLIGLVLGFSLVAVVVVAMIGAYAVGRFLTPGAPHFRLRWAIIGSVVFLAIAEWQAYAGALRTALLASGGTRPVPIGYLTWQPHGSTHEAPVAVHFSAAAAGMAVLPALAWILAAYFMLPYALGMVAAVAHRRRLVGALESTSPPFRWAAGSLAIAGVTLLALSPQLNWAASVLKQANIPRHESIQLWALSCCALGVLLEYVLRTALMRAVPPLVPRLSLVHGGRRAPSSMRPEPAPIGTGGPGSFEDLERDEPFPASTEPIGALDNPRAIGLPIVRFREDDAITVPKDWFRAG